MSVEIRSHLQTKPMNWFQIVAVTICVLISFIDGFDVLAIAYVSPIIAEQWQLSGNQLGSLFSAALLGMVIGALFISPLADRFGRRAIILICLIILSLGMFCSGLSSNYNMLLISRLFTGFGMGAILPLINTVVAEYSSLRYRSLAISIMAVGYTVGSIVSGFLSIYVIHWLSWEYIFYIGGLFSFCLIPATFYYLPDSLDYVLQKNHPSQLKKLNQLLTRLDIPTQQNFPKVEDKTQKRTSFFILFSRPLYKSAILLSVSYFMLMCSFYFLVNWMPKILVNWGYSVDTSIQISLIMNICGIAGGLILGFCSREYALQKVIMAMLFIGFVTVSLLGWQNQLILIIGGVMVIGVALFGAMAGLYATAPILFSTDIRATGTGFVLGVGRLGAALGPYVAGLLINTQISAPIYFFILALPLLIAMLSLSFISYQNSDN